MIWAHKRLCSLLCCSTLAVLSWHTTMLQNITRDLLIQKLNNIEVRKESCSTLHESPNGAGTHEFNMSFSKDQTTKYGVFFGESCFPYREYHFQAATGNVLLKISGSLIWLRTEACWEEGRGRGTAFSLPPPVFLSLAGGYLYNFGAVCRTGKGHSLQLL